MRKEKSPTDAHEFGQQETIAACPPTQVLRHWLDGKGDLSEVQRMHVRQCDLCVQTLEQLTDAGELRPQTDSVPKTPAALPFVSEDALAVLQRELATPPNTPPTNLETLDETPSQAESPSNASVRPARIDADWLKGHFDPNRYVIEGLIGRGGNADVYKLYDNLLDRNFAVKVISVDSERGRQRMLREAKLLADIDHPNIVRVLDARQVGDHLGCQVIFIVMEFMAGGTLTELSGGALPSADVDFRELADLLGSVCDGLSLAHAKGIVHRDIKPANILLGQNRSTAKVADFGLAYQDDEAATLITRTGAILGTPAFMSPEQATGQSNLSPAADIYSLGATLYFMLTRQTPFTGNPTTVARQIVDLDPADISVLNDRCPRELIGICERAMEKEASQRYGNVEEFARDLRAFSSGSQVSARPISALGRATRQLRRNRKLYIAIQAVVALTVLLLVVAVGAVVVYRDQNNRLAESAARERASNDRLQITLTRSIEAADQLLVSVTEDLSLLPSSPGTDRISRALLNRAKQYYQQFLSENADNSELKFQLARAHAGLARIAFRSDDLEQGDAETDRALNMLTALQEASAADEDKASIEQFRASILLVYGSNVGRTDPTNPKADEALVKCIDICAELADEDVGDALATEVLNTHISALRNRAIMLGRIGRDEESGILATEAAGRSDQLIAKDGVSGKSLKAAAEAHQTLGIYKLRHQQFADGAGTLERAMDILDLVPESEGTALRIDSIRANLHTNLARTEMMRGDLDKATEQQEVALEIHGRLSSVEPDVPSHKLNLVDAILNFTNILYAQENYDRLIEESKRAVAVLDELIRTDGDNPDYRQTKAMFQGNMAIVLLHQGKALLSIQPLTESTAELERVAEHLQHAPAADIAVAVNHYSLAGAYYDLGQFEEALKSLDKSDAITEGVMEAAPEFSAASSHMVDSLFRRTDVLLEMQPVDHSAILAFTNRALDLSTDLIEAEPDVVDYQLRDLLIVTTRGAAKLGLGEIEAAHTDAQLVLDRSNANDVSSAAAGSPSPDFTVAQMYAHLLQYNCYQEELAFADGDDERQRIEGKLAAAKEAAEQFGAIPEDFTAPQESVDVNGRGGREGAPN
ncbi:MAG: hypothetical protein Aurels2KO_29180 [Aureliella sp.]